ncbi:MAG: Flp family type IVb pilin [Candidatus Pacebacteria bacterium]|nr:Flp family type IVb pilin [Candidatus Paceibacterota bacterium]MBP9842825.1 Flp family type IVb pilin [Candidatus Paceibacterota bacterium]
MSFFKRFKKDASGATAIEYGLIAALIAVASIAAINGTEKPEPSEEAPMKMTEAVIND